MTEADRENVVDMMRTFYHSPAVWTNGSEEIYNNDVPYISLAFNKNTMTMPSFKDVKIAFKVIEQNTSDSGAQFKKDFGKKSDLKSTIYKSDPKPLQPKPLSTPSTLLLIYISF